jgi:hypothetical protein
VQLLRQLLLHLEPEVRRQSISRDRKFFFGAFLNFFVNFFDSLLIFFVEETYLEKHC